MSLVLGAALGLGLFLTVASFVWPGRPAPRRRRSSLATVGDELQLAGLGSVRPSVVVLVALLLGAIAAAVAHAAFGVSALTFIAAVAGLSLVPAAVHARATRRRAANRAVWPDVVDHLIASVRAGLSLPEALSALATLGPPATRGAFAAFEAEYGRAGAFDPALDGLKARLADPVADRLLETIRMAREVGGTEIAHVLRGLSGYLRDDAALRAEVRSRQSWVRNAARLGVAAPWLLLVVLASKPETVQAYDSLAGTILLLVGLAVTVVAYRAMVALGRLPEARRWSR
jgi:tight adherence protein B